MKKKILMVDDDQDLCLIFQTGNWENSINAIGPTVIDGDYSYRSYRPGEADNTAKSLDYIGFKAEPGYSMGTGTGYNPSGYGYLRYQIRIIGQGPLAAARRVEAQGRYGPVPN